MSDAPDPAMTPEARRAREALASLPRPKADAAFRARLRREFSSGSIAAPRLELLKPRAPWWRSSPAWAAAAAALILAVGLGLGKGPDWSVISNTGSGSATVNGRAIPIDRRDELERALRDGGDLRLGEEARLELGAGGQMVIEVSPGTAATLVRPAGRWFARSSAVGVRSGEIRITTGREFHGARLMVSTPEAWVEVVGTTLAVIRENVGTCVCVANGRVMMGPRGETMAPIEAGRRRFVFNDGRPPEDAEMRATEKLALAQMRARHASRME